MPLKRLLLFTSICFESILRVHAVERASARPAFRDATDVLTYRQSRAHLSQGWEISGLLRVTPRKVRRYLVETVLRYQRYGRIISKLHVFDGCDGQNGGMFRTIWVKCLGRLLGKVDITPPLDVCEWSCWLEITAACPATKKCDAARR
jgi:hypothetical protein